MFGKSIMDLSNSIITGASSEIASSHYRNCITRIFVVNQVH